MLIFYSRIEILKAWKAPYKNLCLESCCGNFRWFVLKCPYIYVIWIIFIVFNQRNKEEIHRSTDFWVQKRLHHKSNLGLFLTFIVATLKTEILGGLLGSHRQFWTTFSSLSTSLLWSSPPFSLSKRSKLESDWRPITVRVAENLSTPKHPSFGERNLQSSWRRVGTNFRPVIDTFITRCNSLR